MGVPNIEVIDGIEYSRPRVFLFQETGVGVAEFAGRTAYDSFSSSENSEIRDMDKFLSDNSNDTKENLSDYESFESYKNAINKIDDAALLDKLAWTYFHHSVLEHAVLSFLIKGMSRGVLQELARHRIATYTIRSTRYVMGEVLNAFNASQDVDDSREWFIDKMIKADSLVVPTEDYLRLEWGNAFDKLLLQKMKLIKKGESWEKLTVAKKSIPLLNQNMSAEDLFLALEAGPRKRNVGDSFKHIVTDNWKVDGMMTINIRSLKNFFDLRDSGAAWFQIRWLAEEMKKVTPSKYLKLIDKKFKDSKEKDEKDV